MAFHPPPPSFELHTPSEPQWFPRPITDTIESSLDLLERVEEDRRRRLRSIATVAARVPIGLGGTEDRGNAGAASAANVSPKPNNQSNRPSNYGRYRYYPPPEETNEDESLRLHRSYSSHHHHQEQQSSSSFSTMVTGRSRDRRKNTTNIAANRRAVASSRNNRSRSTSHSPHSQQQRRDLHTPTDGIGTTTAATAPPTVHMDHDSSANNNNSDSGSSIEGGRFLDSFNVSTSAVLFLSPPFDPRAGGGRTPAGNRRRSSMGSSSRSPWHLYQNSSVDWSMSTPHNTTPNDATSSQQQQQQQQMLQVDTSVAPPSVDASAMMDDTDLITPPAMMMTTTAAATTADQHASAQHGHGEDVYTQRRGATSVRRSQRQRRRRRDWE